MLCQHAEISFESNYDEAKRLLDERVAAQENERRPDRRRRRRRDRCRCGSGCLTQPVSLLVLVLLYGLALVVRRRLLSRHGGTFELSYRVRSEKAGRGWLLGLGRYSGDDLEWFRIFSLSPRPKRVWRASATSTTSAGGTPRAPSRCRSTPSTSWCSATPRG